MYFNKLGTTDYNGVTVPDILKRIVLTGDISDSNIAEQYTISEGESPESLSYNYYGVVDYYWVILLTNNIKSRFFDWPMSSQELGSYVDSKYGSKSALFFQEEKLNNNVNLCDTKYVKAPSGQEYAVQSCDRNLNKIVITKTEPSIIEAGNVVVLQDADKNTIISLPTSRVVYENQYAVHHFVDGEQQPRAYLNQYVAGQGEEYAVSNYDYEVQENENKRSIFLIKPSYVSIFVNQFKALAKAD